MRTIRNQGSRELGRIAEDSPACSSPRNSPKLDAASLALDVAYRSESSDIVRRSSSRLVKGTTEHKPSNIDGSGLRAILLHWLNILLICFPLGLAAVVANFGEVTVFWLMFTSMIPMAKILGDATEELAAGLKNDMLAGLLNATFGNAVEMVITIQTLRRGLFDVVKATLLGSVLSNMLLVLGCSFFLGGIFNMKPARPISRKSLTPMAYSSHSSAHSSNVRESVSSPMGIPTDSRWDGYKAFIARTEVGKVQRFSTLGALVNTSMLLIACFCLSGVTIFASMTENLPEIDDNGIVLRVSRICSIILSTAYVAYVWFQLVTHREAMADDQGEDGEEEDEAAISISTAMFLMFVTTIITAIASEFLVECIEEVTEQAHISQHFIGIILLPIVGNACEHVAAVRFAVQDKPGLSVAIAVGSSTQMALFVVPFAVLVGWWTEEDMDLNFGPLNTTVMTLSVIAMLSMVVDGASNWLQGYLLCAAYGIVAVLYAYLPNQLHTVE